MAIFKKAPFVKLAGNRSKKREIPEGIWTKCVKCSEVLFNKELDECLRVCKSCGHHMSLPALMRVESLCDEGTFEPYDQDLESVDILKFKGKTTYLDRLSTYSKRTGLKEAVISGMGEIEGIQYSLAVMDFSFLGGSMGSVVGEKITRAAERATEARCPLVIVSASGGARMYEGMFSLMQMAKTSGALARHSAECLPYISVLTNPTMAGVMASYASLGDLIIAEPGAMIGFAGARVIKETTQSELPKGFQTAEFLLDHGLIDQIVERQEMKSKIASMLRYLGF
ncbi:MAG: acetyl-CoA carboxylase, carboxyltransferase subunit beta [Verrucomicrobiota bacterium]